MAVILCALCGLRFLQYGDELICRTCDGEEKRRNESKYARVLPASRKSIHVLSREALSQDAGWTATSDDSETIIHAVAPSVIPTPTTCVTPGDVDCTPPRMSLGTDYKVSQTSGGSKRKRAMSRPDNSRPDADPR